MNLVLRGVGQLDSLPSSEPHLPQVPVAGAVAREDHRLAVGGEARLHVAGGIIG